MSSVAVPVSSLPRPSAGELRRRLETALAERIPGAFSIHDRSPEMVASGVAAVDALTGGFPRAALTEIFGPASSGRTTILYAALAAATSRGEACALIDAGDAFDPASAAAAGVDLSRLLWVRCGKLPNCRTAELPNLKNPLKNPKKRNSTSICHSEERSDEESAFQFGNSAVRQFGNDVSHAATDFDDKLAAAFRTTSRMANAAPSRLIGEDLPMPEPRDIGIWGYGDTETMERINPGLAKKNHSPRSQEKTKNTNFPARTNNANFEARTKTTDFPASHPERSGRAQHDRGVERSLTSAKKFKDSPSEPERNASAESAFQFGSSALRHFGNSLRTKYAGAYARLEQAMKAADLLLAGGGFGLVAIDLAGLPAEAARRVPLTSWFRFRRAVEASRAVLLVVSPQALTQSCAALVLQMQPSVVSRKPSAVQSGSSAVRQSGGVSHAELLTGSTLHAEVVRSPLLRKPVRSATAEVQTHARWA